jgi:hypothetical protein
VSEAVPLRAQLVEAALRLLEDEGLVVPPRSLLDMSRRELRDMGCRGLAQSYAVLWLTERIAAWPSHPDVPLVNIIRGGPASDPEVLADIAQELHAVGIRDLDDWLPLDDPGWDRP